MHREFDASESPFEARSNSSLYLLTAVVAALLLADLLPLLFNWLSGWALPIPTWQTREFYGFRFALIAAIFGGAKSLYQSLERLTEGHIGADLAVAIACIAAILLGEPLIAAEVVVIGLIGECLEAFTFDRTQRAVRQLAELFPLRTWVIRDGQEVRIFSSQLQLGDQVVIKPGGKIPVDGTVLSGTSSVDTSNLTGESVPVDKGPGDTVLAGSIVQLGSLTVEAKKLAKQTIAGQVIERTAEALKEKGSGERLADRLARYFLPVVLGMALLTFVFNTWWQMGTTTEGVKIGFNPAARLAAYPTLAVLVVACPCPLLLATPAAVVAALGRLAGTGILLKSGLALERLAEVKRFAFDKTGTLTEGQPELVCTFPEATTSADELLAWAATAEQKSEHPIARALLSAARSRDLNLSPVTQFEARPGFGVCSQLESGERLYLGNLRLMAEQGVTLPDSLAERLQQLEADGQSAILLAKEQQFLGVLGLRDRLRPTAAGALAELQELGMLAPVLLTGDRANPAKAIASRLDNVEVHAELLPLQKAEWIEAHQPVAFVGDGVNDAPALARASVGLAVGSGTDIAAQSSDVVLMGDPLRSLPLLLRLSRETVLVIRQNIIWFGFGVNLVGVLIAGLLWPIFASSPSWFENAPLFGVIYHQLGSLAVLLNSMRLLTFERLHTSQAGKTARRWSQSFEATFARFSLDDLLHEVSHNWKPVLGGSAALGLVVWFASGITQVNPGEVGIIQRFGALRDDLQPGLHIRWPSPIEVVNKLKPNQPRTVEVGFRILPEETQVQLQKARAEQDKLRRPGNALASKKDTNLTWAAAHSEGIQRLTDESLLITGDGNLIELLATVRYRVSDPRKFLLQVKDVDGIIRSCAETVFRERTAAEPFLELLTSRRGLFEQRVTELLNKRLNEVAPDGLGITLEGLTLHDLHPPQEVVSAYHAVAEAIQRRDRMVNDSLADSLRLKRRSEEESMRTVRQAEADGVKKLADANANRDAFLAWVKSRISLTSQEEAKLKQEQEALLKSGVAKEQAEKQIRERREGLLATKRFLTEYRLTMEAMTQVLRGRDKILIEADNLPGKRHLMLMDPELAPRVSPMAFPQRNAELPER
jgi:P-type Cu+ transporter